MEIKPIHLGDQISQYNNEKIINRVFKPLKL